MTVSLDLNFDDLTMTSTKDLISHYREFFYVVRATTPELLEQAFKLRYEVYVKDCGYQFHNPYETDEIEKDHYDERSEHCLLFHKPTNQPMGYVRLIPYKAYCEDRLPIENFGIRFSQQIVEQLRTHQIGEISRLSIHHSFRRRLGDKIYQFENNDDSTESRFRVNYLPACLILACAALMTENNLKYSVALMEKRLAILIKRYGVPHKKIAHDIELNGIRAPYIMNLHLFHKNLRFDFNELLEVIRNELTSSKTINYHARKQK